MKRRYLIVSSICVIFSLIMGIFSHDVIIGGIILLTGLLNSYFASDKKRINYIFGFINYLFTGYVAYKNQLYGLFFFYIFVFSLLQIKGFSTWNQKLDKEGNVKMRGFTFKNSIIIITSCIIGSFLLGYLLTFIPGQRLAFMDASSNCINLCGVILMILRFKESWWIWLVNNIIDLSIWTITFINQGRNSFMVFLSSLFFLLLNIYGIMKWNKKEK